MKKLIVLLFVVLIIGCTPQEYMVQSDYAPNADFNEYETYAFTTHVESNNAEFFFNDQQLKNNIKEDISNELEAKGYRKTTNNPDLLVNFRIFEESGELQGHNQEGQDLYWGTDAIEVDNRRTYQIEPGTLLVDIIDNETKTVVWTGYASGVLEGNEFDTDEVAIASAVENIFEDYNYVVE